MSVFGSLEDKLKTLVEDAVHEAEANVPAIDQVIFAALTDVGAPAPLAQTAADWVKMVIDHFSQDHAAQQSEPAPEPVPDPGTPGA